MEQKLIQDFRIDHNTMSPLVWPKTGIKNVLGVPSAILSYSIFMNTKQLLFSVISEMP